MNPNELVNEVIYLLVQEERGKWIPFCDIIGKLGSTSYTAEEMLDILITECGDNRKAAVQVLEWNGMIYGFRIIPKWWDLLNQVQKCLNLIVGLTFGIQVEKSS